ncbi:MAG: hypothetical protein COW66_10100 [Flavobacteriaceae bacterium CG18_big_fil_WC_8_21_14_2_50_34_36]|nr:MAG: hypothetical protein COW66_10100 [Flavobacteriaceae bacterium CG18_big_fil_WC_8_21_14_2_50_34_36]PIV50164.1 MAG: hypothetical protein COS19_04960 [Flavobacteriaceae bacterium CG02_land_8_20_14_3_00_34_13]
MKNSILYVLVFFLSLPTVFSQEIPIKGKELFGNLKARHIGPAVMSGRISDIELHPSNANIIYAGAAGGGVWKSIDGGTFFTPIFDEHAQSIGSIAIDPTDPDNTVWVGTGETWVRNSVSIGDGIYKTTDGGTNWKKMGLEKSERISGIKINPNNNNEVFVGVMGALWGDSKDRGVYKTSDGGVTWENILYIDEKTGVADLAMDPNNPNILYASMWQFRRSPWSFSSGGENSGLFKTTDGGKTWNKIHSGFPKGKLGRIGLAIAPSQPQTVYIVLETEEAKSNGLYRSDDGGNSWNHLNNNFELVVRPFYFSRITIDPKNPDILVKGGLNGAISRDGGKTFKPLGTMHPDIHDIAFHINNSDIMFVGTDGGVYRSWNGGSTLEIVENIPVSQYYHVSVDNAEPYNVYGGLQDNGSWYGPSSAPGGVKAKHWNSVGIGDGFRVLKHPTKNIIYSEMQGAANVWRYDVDRVQTKTIQPMAEKGDPKLRFNWNTPMALSKFHPDRFYMGSQFLHKSEDMGDTWVKISPDLTTNDLKKQDQSQSGGLSIDNSGAETHTTIFTIAESPLDENIIWVGTDDGNVQVTQDAGKTWTNTIANVPNLPKNTWCYKVYASNFNKGAAYAVFEGHATGNMTPYAYKTTDFGRTWKSIITEDVKGFARSILEDYKNENLLFLGTEFGLYITVDGGINWSQFTNNMPAAAVMYIALQEKTNDLVLATHGRGIIIIDDISPLREVTNEIMNKEVHFFSSKPMVMPEEGGFSEYFGTETQFVGQNPSTNARIVYYLNKRHTFGKMEMEVQDLQGNTIAKLNPGKSKGLNIVDWTFTSRGPKIAEAKTISFGGFAAPRVPAGKYNVVMTKGKDTFIQPIELIYDPNSLVTDEGRKERNNMVKILFDMNENLAYTVYKMNISIKRAEDLLLEDANAKKVAQPVINDLNTLLKTMVVTTGDNYVASAEPELREKLADLYSSVTNNYDRPTGAQMANYEAIKEKYDSALTSYKAIHKKQVSKLEDYLKKQNKTPLEFKSFEEFLK